jgi:iron complex outermembrane receptor protein
MRSVLFDAAGHDLLRAPESALFLGGEVIVPVGSVRVPVVVTYAHKQGYYFDFVADPSSQRLRQSSYGLLSARATLISPDEHWQFALWGNNLTAEDDYFMDIVANSSGIRGSHGAPRTWGLDVTYRF